jgi:hypothetical protein
VSSPTVHASASVAHAILTSTHTTSPLPRTTSCAGIQFVHQSTLWRPDFKVTLVLGSQILIFVAIRINLPFLVSNYRPVMRRDSCGRARLSSIDVDFQVMRPFGTESDPPLSLIDFHTISISAFPLRHIGTGLAMGWMGTALTIYDPTRTP